MSDDQLVSALLPTAFVVPAVIAVSVIIWLIVLYYRHAARPDPRDRISGYAVASLAASTGTIFTPFLLGSIAGIILGHCAMRQTNINPCLGGRRIARWGLIVGYGSFLIVPAYVLAVLGILGFPHGHPIWTNPTVLE
ncbi:MAG TPA: DUF4190 domain-containing protein [Chthoniobacteraceae bacterium]|jgi:hypothetical protein|nr:DUF4190 domain-containing protein [Chthoniobacteraceae bacterium]